MMDFKLKSIMVMPAPWLVLIFLTVVLFEAVLYVWLSGLDQADVQQPVELSMVSSIWQEPITPIPIIFNLDARKIALGRRLFHDQVFSRSNKISCASCHDLARGGTDGSSHAKSPDRKAGSINTLTVYNSGLNYRLFWEGYTVFLEDLLEFPMQHAYEMDATWAEIVNNLNMDPVYRKMFSQVYEDDIGIKNVKDALATFVRSLVTPNSRFDRYLRGDKKALNKSELAGYILFKNLGCISCHQGRNVGGNMFEKLGLIDDYYSRRGNIQATDMGRYNITKDEQDRYEFRVPSLRNVALTAPYFHDGSVGTLEQAVLIMAKYQLGVELRSDEVKNIASFLGTLTGEYEGKQLSVTPQTGVRQ